ncbi:MAG: family peptidase [Acidobacteria bacterium]|nr:family peptidase [Acidobacteriota bacterium]
MFQAVREATEEAVYNSLFMAGTVTGYAGHTVEAIPVDKVLEICREHKVLRETR